MKAVRIESPGNIHLVEVPVPEPPKGFVRVKVKAAAICATDLEVLDGRIAAKYPLIPGHEWSGIVDKTGPGVDECWLGERVIGSNDVVCLTCPACRRGEWRYCKSFEEIGFKRDGAYAEYVIVPAYGLCRIPEHIRFEEAALCEPLGVALGTMKKSHAKLGDTCLIMGAGSIGLCTLAVAKAMGLRDVVVCASSRKRETLARRHGADHFIAASEQDLMEEMARIHPDGTDVIIDATGMEACIQKALKLCRKGGTVVLEGYGRGKTMQICMDDIHINNLHVIGAGNNWNMHQKAMDLISSGVIDIRDFVSEKISLEDFEKGMELVRSRPEGFVKVEFVL
ncbi:MAG: alcohol dehydrogenase catalytic domain-containing protein [Blautia sp.]|nr:alcohol dehydrogenase catalytic domain-containing protein [Blautia sp.]MDY3998161.1 alcohol dehydrogenase catalytic domain-containing protein [Blautia sp.]